jgi:hypothetical protein
MREAPLRSAPFAAALCSLLAPFPSLLPRALQRHDRQTPHACTSDSKAAAAAAVAIAAAPPPAARHAAIPPLLRSLLPLCLLLLLSSVRCPARFALDACSGLSASAPAVGTFGCPFGCYASPRHPARSRSAPPILIALCLHLLPTAVLFGKERWQLAQWIRRARAPAPSRHCRPMRPPHPRRR